ncbi:MAG: hypothetical protein RML45_07355 [Acetobacteraceae bacterium]|nr:hypothetical protein [Acetobacteraceae bacterium]
MLRLLGLRWARLLALRLSRLLARDEPLLLLRLREGRGRGEEPKNDREQAKR